MKLKQLIENEVPKIIDPDSAFRYAHNKGTRVPELEHVIMKTPRSAFNYVMFVTRTRWPEAEPVIMKDPYYTTSYLRMFPELSGELLHKNIPLMLVDDNEIKLVIIKDVKGDITKEQFSKLFSLLYPKVSKGQLDYLRLSRVFTGIEEYKIVKEYTIQQLTDISFEEFFYDILNMTRRIDNDFE